MSDPLLRDLADDLRSAISSLKPQLPKGPLRAAWPSVQELIADRVDEALDDRLISLLAGVWADQADVDLEVAGSTHDVAISGKVTLGHHKIMVTLDPDLTVTVNGAPISRVVLTVSFEVTVHGAVLTIKDGALEKADLGSTEVTGRLACNGVTVPVTAKPISFDALGTHVFNPPLRLAKPASSESMQTAAGASDGRLGQPG